jgi:hypothetical protein
VEHGIFALLLDTRFGWRRDSDGTIQMVSEMINDNEVIIERIPEKIPVHPK